ncbi:MAG: alpha/beta hydrolase [Myxococcaceae bacterium]|jgi:pimeloyl-ACP methyl ester carboxylesterase|nr:alpha/beta hydrolase [Myxococcaceae bacterium]
MSLFTSPAGKQALVDWYERFHARLTVPTERRTVATRFGDTHVLVAGPKGAPDVVMLHGALASSAHLLGELEGLAKHFRVHAVDVIGQSVKSADAQPSPKTDDYGHWLAEVMDGLSLARASVIGVSWGGFAALRFAAVAPGRVERLALLVPAGLVTGPLWAGFSKVFWPMTRYRRKPTPENLAAATKHLLTTHDDDWTPYLGTAMTAFTSKMTIPRLARPDEFSGFTAPVLVIGADGDLSFPGEAVVARARALFRGPVESELLKDVRHSPPTTAPFRAWMAERLTRFLTDGQGTTGAAPGATGGSTGVRATGAGF